MHLQHVNPVKGLSPPGKLTNGHTANFCRMPLVEALTRHNRIHRRQERIQLRLALHAGDIDYDRGGVTGSSINRTYRLLLLD